MLGILPALRGSRAAIAGEMKGGDRPTRRGRPKARDVLGVGHGFRLALVGVTVGVFAAWALTRLLGTLLEGVSATDPLTDGLVVLALGGVAVFASYLPARRAVKVDPVISLKAE